MMSTFHPKQIARPLSLKLKSLDTLPLIHSNSPFPLDQLSHHLSKTLGISSLTIEHVQTEWRENEQLNDSLGTVSHPLTFKIPNLKGVACVLIPDQVISLLFSLSLNNVEEPVSLSDPELTKGFTRFLALDLLQNWHHLKYNAPFLPILQEESTLPQEPCLVFDLAITTPSLNLPIRLLLTPLFQKSWNQNIQDKARLDTSNTTVPLSIEIGRLSLTPSELLALELGDSFLLNTDFNSTTLEGDCLLTYQSSPLLTTHLAGAALHILDMTTLYQGFRPMAKLPPFEEPSSEDSDEFSAFTMEEDEDDEFSDGEHSSLTEDGFTEEDNELSDEEPSHLPSSDATDSEDQPKQASSASEPTSSASPARTVLKREEIPLTLSVEIGQIEIPLNKLMALQTGNMLDIFPHPSGIVQLVCQGHAIGTGELLQVGEQIAVRITALDR